MYRNPVGEPRSHKPLPFNDTRLRPVWTETSCENNHESNDRKFHSSALTSDGIGGRDCYRIRWYQPVQQCHHQGTDDRCALVKMMYYAIVRVSNILCRDRTGSFVSFQPLEEQFLGANLKHPTPFPSKCLRRGRRCLLII